MYLASENEKPFLYGCLFHLVLTCPIHKKIFRLFYILAGINFFKYIHNNRRIGLYIFIILLYAVFVV